MNKNRWFKHYNSASQGNSIRILWDAGDTEAIAFWWRLLELVSMWEDETRRGTVTLSWGILRRELGWNRQRVTRVLTKIVQTFGIKVEAISDETFEVSIPNWLEYQGTWGGKKEARLSQDATDLRLKTKDIRFKTSDLDLDQDSKIKKMLSDAGIPLPDRLKS